MANRSYEPASRERHVSFAVEGKVYMWGGNKKSSEDGEIVGSIEQFDPYLEVWSQLPTMRTPHPGLYGAACTSFGRRMYIYGGRIKEDMICAAGVLSCLDIQTFAWSMFYSTSGGPMGKTGCGMVHFHHDKLAVIGGHGILTGSTQPGSSFIRNTRYTDGRGWTNEIHVFNISRGNYSQINF